MVDMVEVLCIDKNAQCNQCFSLHHHWNSAAFCLAIVVQAVAKLDKYRIVFASKTNNNKR
jgi:hypothetical protein